MRTGLEEFIDVEAGHVDEDEIFDGSNEVAVAEASSDYQATSTNFARSTDMITALEDLQDVLSKKLELTPSDVQIVNIAAEMALSGTGFSNALLIPSMESCDLNIAVEGIGEKIKGMLTGMLNVFIRIMKSLHTFISNVGLAFRSYIGRAMHVKERLRKLKAEGKSKAGEVSVKFRPVFLTSSSSTRVTSIKDLAKHYNESMTEMDVGIGAVAKNAKVIGEEVGVMETLRQLSDVQETATRFYKDVDQFSKEMIKDLKMVPIKTQGGMKTYAQKTSLGAHVYTLRRPETDKPDFNDYKELKRTAHMFSIEIEDQEMANRDTSKLVFENVTIDELISLVDDSVKHLTSMGRHFAEIDRLYASTALKIEESVTHVIGLVAAALLSASTVVGSAAATKATVANVAVSTMDKAKTGSLSLAGKFVGLFGHDAIKALVFSYRMMTVNNDLVYGSLNSMSRIASSNFSDVIFFINEAAIKGDWE